MSEAQKTEFTTQPLRSRRIILGISGGIAAYKTVDLISSLRKLGADVHVVCTENALRFVSKLSLETISNNKVHTRQFEDEDQKSGFHNIDHIELADNADLILIAPATANTVGKLAAGISDNLLLDLCLASKAPVMLAPAMNTNMWKHAIVQENLEKLQTKLGYEIIDPDFGELACGHVGEGRLAELDTIVYRTIQHLSKSKTAQTNNLQNQQDFKDKKVLISAGGTREAIDPVRFIGNRSSGKMGIAIADEAHRQGAEVCLVSTVLVEKPYEVRLAGSATEMEKALVEEFPGSNITIMAAAVADFKPSLSSESKIKKSQLSRTADSNAKTLSLELEETTDILEELGREKRPEQILVGFALETDNLIENAKEKLVKKNLDFLVANGPETLDSEDAELIILTKDGGQKSYPKSSKTEAAKLLLEELLSLESTAGLGR